MLGLHEGPHCGRRKQKQRDLFPISLIQKSESWTVSEMIKPNLFTLKTKKLKKKKKKSTFKQKL